MRLIDADALPMYEELFMNGINNSGVWVRYRDVENLIRNAPTIEERKKGRWLDKGRKICCSECGRSLFCATNFCPECGADMRGDGNDN